MNDILLNDFIKISKGFVYSVNIKWDLYNLEKINSYVPTKESLEISKQILKDQNGAHLLVGSYGTGKSHLVSVLVSLVSGKYNTSDLGDLLEKIKNSDVDLFKKVNAALDSKSRKMIVFPEDSLSDFKQAVLVGIKNALKKANLDDILPRTYFDVIREKLNDWLKNYNDVYQLFNKNIKSEYGIEIEQFSKMLGNLDTQAYEIFKNIYPKLTAGSVFSPMYYVDLIEYIQEIEQQLTRKGYDGLYITFDEFGKYLEENIEGINTQDVQILAEYCNAKDSNTGLILITHKDFAQYTNRVNNDIVYEWRKIEGRFNKAYLRTDKYQSYDIISQIIIKEERYWKQFQDDYKDKFNEIRYNMLSIKLFQDLSSDLFNKLIDGVYPLNPSATFCLVRLSEKLAQNERTMFTFLCSDENLGLKSYMSRKYAEFPLFNVEVIYDYFENLMKTDGVNSEAYNIWKKSNRALQLIDNNSINQRNIIKALAVVNIINNIDILPPNQVTIKALLNMYNDNFNKSIQTLLENKILFERKSLEHYFFYESSYINIFEEIEKREASFTEDFITLLNKYFQPVPILPRKYNDDNYISRYFLCEYIGLEQINSNYIDNEFSKNYLDGKIYYIIPQNPEELKEASKVLESLTRFPQSIFIIPKSYLPFSDIVKKYSILQEMLEDEEFLKRDPLLYDEVCIYIDETKEEINKLLSNILNNDYRNIYIYYQGTIVKDVSTRLQLSNKLSEICSCVYSQSPAINNELVNKDNLTATMKKVMKNVIAKLWQDNLEDDLGFKPFSAEHTLTKTILINTNILRKDDTNYSINYSDNHVSSKIRNIMILIEDFLQKSKNKEIKFIDLYKELKNPPYGIRDGIIPIIITLAIKKYSDVIYIKDRNIYTDLEPSVVLDMIKKPESFNVILDIWDNDKRQYIESLETFFKPDNNISKKNRLRALYIALKEKFIKISKFSRVTKRLSEQTLEIRNIIEKDYSDFRGLFYERLPGLFNMNYRTTYKSLVGAFIEMEASENNLRKEMSKYLISVLEKDDVQNNIDLNKSILNWYKNLNSEETKIIYSNKANMFLDLAKNIDQIENPLDFIAAKLTGFYLGYWNDAQIELFKEDIIDIINEIKRGSEKVSDHSYLEIAVSQNGEYIEKQVENTEISFIGESLFEKLKNDISNFGSAIDENEKRTVLLKLLKEFL